MMLNIWLVVLLSLRMGKVSASSSSKSFCSEVKPSCPSPPTIDSLNIHKYVGLWYEIGSTAKFKFQNEAGLVCGQGNYSLLSPPNQNGLSSKLSILNSGLPLITSTTAHGVSLLSSSVKSFCLSSKQICTHLLPLFHNISAIAQLLSSSYPNQASRINNISATIISSLNLLETQMNSLASRMSMVQLVNARINEAVGEKSDNVAELRKLLGVVREEVDAAREALTTVGVAAAEIRNLSISVAGADQSLGEAIGFVEGEADGMMKRVEKMEEEVKEMEETWVTYMVGEEGSMSGVEEEVRSVRGEAIQSSTEPGKLEMTVNGFSGDYWIIDLEGEEEEGYSASLVYSCREGQEEDDISEDMFIISRNRNLPAQTIAQLLKLAQKEGISTTCENPFVYTLQRQGDCGTPTK